MKFTLSLEDKELDLIMLSMQQTVRSINDVASNLQNQAQQIVFEQQEKARQEAEALDKRATSEVELSEEVNDDKI